MGDNGVTPYNTACYVTEQAALMTLLYYDSLFLEHDTGAHPECALRLKTVMARLEKAGLDRECQRPEWEDAPIEALTAIHERAYCDSVAEFVRRHAGERIESDTVVSDKSYSAAIRASGAARDATRRVVQGESKTALCLVRPPGHHALEAEAMGFCLFNHVAVGAAAALREEKLDRVLIVDWDVHHGNGTQDIFWREERVGFFSAHRWPFYPGTGARDETGGGNAIGTKANLPIAFGTSRESYREQFLSELEKLAARVRPQLTMVSAGFDAHRLDPIGSLGLEVEDFEWLTRTVGEIAKTHSGGKLVSVLEGGYHPDMLAESVEIHLKELLKLETE